jgi:transposase
MQFFELAQFSVANFDENRTLQRNPWLIALLKRKSPKPAAVALANKTARIAWKMMITGEPYAERSASTVLAGALQ